MSVRKSLAITSVENNIHTILSLIMMVAISRLLSPDEIGIHVIGASIAMLAAELKAFGMGGYLVREKDINSIKVRTTFTVSMLFAFTLGATLIITSSIIADFYSDQRLVPVLMLFSIGFFVAPFSIVTSAVLTRNFEFGKLSIVRLSEVLMSAVTTLILIYFDFGYISLAIGTAVGNISSTVLFVIFRPNIVSYLPYFSDLNVVLKSGFFTSFAALIRRGETVSPELIIGKMADISGAALFSRGMGFIKFSSSIVLGMISPVVAPYLSKSNRQGEILADSYIKVNLLVGGICWPILAVAGVFAEQAITLMFGEQWTAAAPIASTLAIWALLGMFYVNFEVLLLTIGKEKYTFFYQIILSIVTVILCIGAALIDSALVPFALIGSGILKVLMQAILFKKFLGISIFSYLWQLKQSILVTIACFTIALFMKYITTHLALNAFYSIIILAIAMSIFWLICIFIFKHPLKSELATVVTAAIKVWKAKKKQ
jgi:O-antigen/teichoic acid export membrane protein